MPSSKANSSFPSENIPPPKLFPSDNEGGSASDNRGFEREVEAEVEVEVEGRRPRRKQPQASLKAAENT
jgi:hypothetical protein